jgi:hypothetical protein
MGPPYGHGPLSLGADGPFLQAWMGPFLSASLGADDPVLGDDGAPADGALLGDGRTVLAHEVAAGHEGVALLLAAVAAGARPTVHVQDRRVLAGAVVRAALFGRGEGRGQGGVWRLGSIWRRGGAGRGARMYMCV